MLPEVSAGKIWMEMSTTDEAEVKRLGAMVTERGGAAVDCPVSGGCHRAATGNIAILAGCDRATFERILPLLTTMGRRVLHTGAIGSASVLKVITITGDRKPAHMLRGAGDREGRRDGHEHDLRGDPDPSSGNSFVHETESQVILNGSATSPSPWIW